MPDKFFFNGRQDARENYAANGFQTKASKKLGSKKYPLTLVVKSEKRKKEVEAQVIEAELFADISIDKTKGAVESIEQLIAFQNKVASVKQQPVPARNELCSCGSGKKYKKCCG